MIPEGGADVSTDVSYRGYRRLHGTAGAAPNSTRYYCWASYPVLGFSYNPDLCFVDTNWITVISKEDGPSFINFIFHRIVFLTHHTGAGG